MTSLRSRGFERIFDSCMDNFVFKVFKEGRCMKGMAEIYPSEKEINKNSRSENCKNLKSLTRC